MLDGIYKDIYFLERIIKFVTKKVRNISILLSAGNIENWCGWLAKNNIFTVLCGIATLVGFFITVYISLKTKSINQRLGIYKKTQEFNKKRKTYISTLEGYQRSLAEDKID